MSETDELARFRRLVEAYGARPDRWPAAERDWAAGLAAAPAARERLEPEAALDAMLDAAPPDRATPELMADVLAAAGAPAWRRWAKALWPFGPLWQPAAGLAAAALVGLVIGFAAPATQPPEAALVGDLVADALLGAETL